MEPIEQDLAERKTRLRKLAIELQRMEDKLPGLKRKEASDLKRRIAATSYTLGALKFSIRELEEIIAEGPTPARFRPTPPDTSRRRVLTDAERSRVVRNRRRQLLARMREDDPDFEGVWLEVWVERVTDLDGEPIVGFRVSVPKPRRI
jgi:hypothetical protein